MSRAADWHLMPEALLGLRLLDNPDLTLTMMLGQPTELTMMVCEERAGPTPIHPEPGRETAQRHGYWGSPWETRSVHHLPFYRGMEQWQLVGLITRRSMVRIHLPLPARVSRMRNPFLLPAM